MSDDDRFAGLSHEDQRRYMARAIGCNPNEPAGWPDRIIEDLIRVRLTAGSKEYYRKLGYLLSLC